LKTEKRETDVTPNGQSYTATTLLPN
jgi:hypothetical protein